MPDSFSPWMPGVRMVGRVVDVRPVDERRDARVDALERAGQVAGVDVLGPVQRREAVEHLDEVVVERGVRRAAADRRLPRVPVRVDEAGDHDASRAVDHLGVGREVPAHLRRSCRPRSGRRRRRCRPAAGSTVITWPPRSRIRSAIFVPFLARRIRRQCTARRTPSTIRSTDGIARSSSASADGSGRCGVVTRTIGPSSE